ncbi:unnamed protein product [Ceutorhynchus assimilis]|uniref:N-acetyltransferase ESCO2 n=1 Tax=Ceutorhynchus assimilis TaxID=467358 RepID=A0A9N9QD90_9CUCU|nr:unnamed protein product [Ceutorhynchus assimilis]
MTSTFSKRRDHKESIRSPYILERRRNLFPSTTTSSNEESELGYMCRLDSSDSDNDVPKTPKRTSPENISSLTRSPWSQSLSTPNNDTSSNDVMEKEQRIIMEESKNQKRKENSPEKCSKVRTALFPATENAPLSTKLFYGNQKQQNYDYKDRNSWRSRKLPVIPNKINRKYPKKFVKGQINNGVRHKIRRPKRKPVDKKLLKNGEILNEYLKDLSELNNKPKAATIIHASKDAERQKPPQLDAVTAKIVHNSEISNTCLEDLSELTNKSNKGTVQSGTKIEKFPQLNATANEVNEAEKSPSLATNYEFEDEFEPPQVNIENILSILADESSTISVGSIHRGSTNILSPISQMCDVTSGLALTSPQKPKNLRMSSGTSKMLSFSNADKMAEQQQERKLFPVFQKGATAGLLKKDDNERGEKRSCDSDVLEKHAKRFKVLGPDQMLLDAGQKRFGLTECTECNICYHQGDPNDELQHSSHHNALQVLRFSGWKNERVVADHLSDGRIIRILPSDSKVWLKKVEDLMVLVNRDLGCYGVLNDISKSQVYMYIKNRTIAGCVVAKSPQEPGHLMLGDHIGVSMCSKEPYPIKCGISHIWVRASFRKQGIATAMMDAVKCSFFTGYVLSNNDIALTAPTIAGAAFAEKYFKTSNYLIYFN